MSKIKVLLLFFLLPSVALAQEWNDDNPIVKEFTADTARVEQHIRRMLDSDYSTVGMLEASAQLEAAYDVLLNKYYKKLVSALTKEEKATLKAAQLSWISYRDKEKALISALQRNTYERMGGGTMWAVVAASDRAELTKRRVVELYSYLVSYGF